jgi:ankyrin repeat protein
VDLLIINKADVNAKDNVGGETPLWAASITGHRDTVQVLLDHGAAVNARSKNGETPLTVAISEHHRDVAELLRQHGGHT